MEASVLDLRKKMREVLEAIDRRETVTLTHRGRRKAIILPYPEKKSVRIEDLPAFGMWKDREDMSDPVAYVNKLREGRRF